eukprot:1195507-Prorocentrum_minimum.AAC.2
MTLLFLLQSERSGVAPRHSRKRHRNTERETPGITPGIDPGTCGMRSYHLTTRPKRADQLPTSPFFHIYGLQQTTVRYSQLHVHDGEARFEAAAGEAGPLPHLVHAIHLLLDHVLPLHVAGVHNRLQVLVELLGLVVVQHHRQHEFQLSRNRPREDAFSPTFSTAGRRGLRAPPAEQRQIIGLHWNRARIVGRVVGAPPPFPPLPAGLASPPHGAIRAGKRATQRAPMRVRLVRGSIGGPKVARLERVSASVGVCGERCVARRLERRLFLRFALPARRSEARAGGGHRGSGGPDGKRVGGGRGVSLLHALSLCRRLLVGREVAGGGALLALAHGRPLQLVAHALAAPAEVAHAEPALLLQHLGEERIERLELVALDAVELHRLHRHHR